MRQWNCADNCVPKWSLGTRGLFFLTDPEADYFLSFLIYPKDSCRASLKMNYSNFPNNVTAICKAWNWTHNTKIASYLQ